MARLLSHIACKKSSTTFFVFVLAYVLFSSFASAQVLYDGNNNLPPFGSYSGSDFDTVSLQNGNLHISIPILSLSQRGKPLTYHFIYDTPDFTTTVIPPKPPAQFQTITIAADTWYTGWALLSSLDWSVQQQAGIKAACSGFNGGFTTYTYTVVDPERSKHPVAVINAPGDPCQFGTTRGLATDGSGILYDLNQGIFLKDGTHVSGGQIEDENGNINTTGSTVPTTITDTVDRTPLAITDGPKITYTTPLGKTVLGPQYETWTYKDSSGNSQTWRVDYIAIDFTNRCGSAPHCLNGALPKVVPSRLTLPTGRFYQFTWQNNDMGELTRIDLPTGGFISYTYSIVTQQNPDTNTTVSDSRMGVRSRTVGHDGTTATWSYSSEVFPPVTVTDPLGNDEVHVFSGVSGPGSAISYGSYEKEVQYWKGSSTAGGTLLKKIDNTYTAEADPTHVGHNANVRIIQQDTTLDNGLVRRTQTDYETFSSTYQGVAFTATYMNPTAQREYDYGSGAPGSLMRTTSYSYLHTNNQAYINANIVDRVLVKTVANGGGNLFQETINEYDNYSHAGFPMQASGAVQHDSARGTSYTLRGNVTATENWRNTDGAMLTTVHQYDDAGNVIATQDPNGNVTHFDFTDSWSNASCAPSPQAKAYETKITNALGHVTTNIYNSCVGSLASTTDPNNQTTSYSYDLLGRLMQSTLPDTGGTSYCFSDNPAASCYNSGTPLTETITKKMTASTNEVSTSVFDGLGRVEETQLNTDPEGEDYVDTTYDALGRKSTVSNPYRSGVSLPTNGTTSYSYDPLDRTTSVQEPDNSLINTSYSGNCSTVTDEAGKARKSCSDGLGRMIDVFEDPSGLNYETDYQYDPLGNLLLVSQIGGSSNPSNWHERSFTYNSLSELLTASNPESGTMSYNYDADGNVISRTDARGIVTTYHYDPLNRVTEKDYSDGTQSAFFAYDTSSQWAATQTNIVGRLQEAWTGTSCCGATTEFFSYDPVGRAILYLQCTPQNCATPNYTTSYAYDLAGDMTSAYNGENITISYNYDTAGRPISVTSSANDAQHPPTLYSTDPSIGYFPAGQPRKGIYGNGLIQTNVFNNRLQPCLLDVNSSNVTLQTCNDSTPSGNVLDLWMGYGATNNNGNMLNWNATGAQSFVRTYSYDPLNRVQTQNSTGSGPSLSWTYDPWGNRTAQSVTGGTGYAWNSLVDNNNRLLGGPYSYDASGNLLTDGNHTYTYDAENRIATVDGGATRYVYNVTGQRVEKVVGGAWEDYIHDLDGNVVSEVNANTVVADYIYLGGSLLAEYQDSTTFFITKDHLGSTRLLTAAGPSTRIQSSGGTNAWKYYYTGTCPSVSGTTYTISGMVTNQGTAPVEISGNIVNSPVIYPGSTQQVNFSEVGNGVSCVQFGFVTLNTGDPIDVLAFAPSITASGGNLIPSTNQDFSGWNPYSGASVTITEGEPALITDNMDYQPFGEQIAGSTGTTHKFTGKERDAETGDDYFGARYYASSIGRFFSADSSTGISTNIVNPQKWNLYSYVVNNPLFYVDPDGNDSISATTIIGTGSVTLWYQGWQSLDVAEMVASAGIVETESYKKSIGRNESPFGISSPDSGGGCVAGCAYFYHPEDIGFNIVVSFTWDEKENAPTGANITFQQNPSIAFMRAFTPIRTERTPIPGGLGFGPDWGKANISQGALEGMSDAQLDVLQRTVQSKLSSSSIYEAIWLAIASEKQRRQDAAKKHAQCQQSGSCPNTKNTKQQKSQNTSE